MRRDLKTEFCFHKLHLCTIGRNCRKRNLVTLFYSSLLIIQSGHFRTGQDSRLVFSCEKSSDLAEWEPVSYTLLSEPASQGDQTEFVELRIDAGFEVEDNLYLRLVVEE